MNPSTIAKIFSIATRVVTEIAEGLRKGESNEEIRKRIATRAVILDEELNELRGIKTELDDYVRTGR